MNKEALEKAEKLFKIAEKFRSGGDFKNAIETYKRSLSSFSYNSMCYVGLGLCYLELQKIEKARTSFDSAFKFANYSGRSPQIKLSYAIFLKTIGKVDEAMRYYRDCCEEEYPLNITSFNYLTRYDRTITTSNKIYKNVSKSFKTNSHKMPRELKKAYYFSVARVYENMEDYKKSWFMYYRGNKLSTYKHITDSILKANELMKLFVTEKFKLNDISEYAFQNNRNIVFILGEHRSGASLVNKIISAHTKAFSLGESGYLEQVIFNKKKIQDFYTNKMKNESTETNDNTNKSADDIMKEYLKTVNHPSKDDYKYFASEYLERVRNIYKTSDLANKDIKLLTDHTPENILYIGYILCMFPNAKFIYCKRNFLDMAVSQYQTEFEDISNGKTSVYYNLDNITKQHTYYNECIEHWTPFIKNKLMIVNYEDLVNNSEEIIPNLIKHCDLEFEDRCLTFYKEKSVVKSVSVNGVYKPIYTTSVGKWKKYEQYIPQLISYVNHK